MKHLILVLLTIALVAPTATAQESGQLGVTFTAPAGLGVVVQVDDRVAIRPEGSFAFTNSDTVDANSWSLGLSGLFNVSRSDALRTYVAPRYAYSHTTSGTKISALTTSSHHLGGSFGAQYSLHRRFGVFGEIGVDVSTLQGGTGFSTRLKSTQVASRSSVGAIFYLK